MTLLIVSSLSLDSKSLLLFPSVPSEACAFGKIEVYLKASYTVFSNC
jgi:hypothetical protein